MNSPSFKPSRLARALVPLLFSAAVVFASPDRVPKFSDYPVKRVYRGKTAPIVWTREALTFRTRLREAARGRPDFAGRYIVTTWGCGADCSVGAFIDAKTGRVFWFPFPVGWDYETQEEFRPAEFRLDSRLIVFHGYRVDRDEEPGARFYEFRGGRFRFLKFVKNKKGEAR